MFVAIYLALDAIFSYATVREGLVSPRGVPHVTVLLLGFVVLCARFVVRFLFPFLLVYRAFGSLRRSKLHSMLRTRWNRMKSAPTRTG
ncbi:MAG: hypothetical protein U0174_13865 [Polyangiaceae bacterium]